MNYTTLAATAKRILENFGATLELGDHGTMREAVGVRLNVENHFIDTGGLNSAFGMAKVSVGDYFFILEGGANPEVGERLIAADGTEFIISDSKPIRPTNVTLAWLIYVRDG